MSDAPRCQTCRHWRSGPSSVWGFCEAVTETTDSAWLDTDDDRLHLCTSADHGCTMHEAGTNFVSAFMAEHSPHPEPTEETP